MNTKNSKTTLEIPTEMESVVEYLNCVGITTTEVSNPK